MAGEMLGILGYTPVLSNHGADAFNLFKSNIERFALVIADQVMPGMRGLELAQKIKSIRPDMPIILCTGFSETFIQQQAEALGVAGILMKPIVMRDLAEKIRAALTKKTQ